MNYFKLRPQDMIKQVENVISPKMSPSACMVNELHVQTNYLLYKPCIASVLNGLLEVDSERKDDSHQLELVIIY